MKNAVVWLARGFVAAFIFIALVSGYWGVIRNDELLDRPDNPRLVLAEQIVKRGQILDRNDTILAESVVDEQTGFVHRQYPYPSSAPVVGYYSIRYATGELENNKDTWLRGNDFTDYTQRVIDSFLHRTVNGGDIKTTLDIGLQEYANHQLDGHKGAVVLLNAATGEVLALASAPSYDPNTLDELWDKLKDDPSAPLLNRPLQGLYQPGAALETVILATALNNRSVQLTQPWVDALDVPASGGVASCAIPLSRNIETIKDAYLWGCPRPFQNIGLRLGQQLLTHAFDDFGLLAAPAFDLPAQPTNPSPDPVSDVALSSIGQSQLLVTPLQMALVAASIANNGEMPAPYVVQAQRIPGQGWIQTGISGNPRGTVSPETAATLQSLMLDTVSIGAAQAATSTIQVYGHVGLALAGPEKTYNTWFIGFAESSTTYVRFAICVLLDGENDPNLAARIGGKVLEQAANPTP